MRASYPVRARQPWTLEVFLTGDDWALRGRHRKGSRRRPLVNGSLPVAGRQSAGGWLRRPAFPNRNAQIGTSGQRQRQGGAHSRPSQRPAGLSKMPTQSRPVPLRQDSLQASPSATWRRATLPLAVGAAFAAFGAFGALQIAMFSLWRGPLCLLLRPSPQSFLQALGRSAARAVTSGRRGWPVTSAAW